MQLRDSEEAGGDDGYDGEEKFHEIHNSLTMCLILHLICADNVDNLASSGVTAAEYPCTT